MHAAAHHVSVADGEAFLSTSRLLFGPITQRFTRDAVASTPKLMSVQLGPCRLSEIKANAHVVVNDRAFWRSFDPDAVKILMQRSGRSRFEQQAMAVELGPRSAIIYDPVRTYSLQNLSGVEQLILQVPRSTFNDDTLARLAAPVPLPAGDDSLTHIVSGLMQMAIDEAHRLDPANCQRVGDSLIQLVNGLIRGKAPEWRGSPLEALRERIVAYVDANLSRASLSAEDIARHMGCSRRYLHRAFEGEGTTLERLVWDRRLERSREALLSSARQSLSISEIAFACGFNSSAHFSRAFKSKYGAAPRELRERMTVQLH